MWRGLSPRILTSSRSIRIFPARNSRIGTPASGSWALITGATAGLGAEFAKQLRSAGFNLVLIARNETGLKAKAAQLRDEFGVGVEEFPADLLVKQDISRVCDRLRDQEKPVEILVNNAGFGLVTPFEESSLEDEEAHLRLLVQTPLELSHVAVQEMLQRGRGQIINVASVAAFIPRGTYGAAKSWLLSFSRWANLHYKKRGVTVTAVCPGFVHTEFHQRMGASTKGIPGLMWLNADQVVREALAAANAGKAVSIPSKRYKTLIWLSKFLPDRLAAAAGHRGR